MLLTVGVAILETAKHGTASVGGLVVVGLALLLMSYGLAQFRWRLRKILRKDPAGYDDPTGPVLLVSVLVTGMVLYLVLKFLVVDSSATTSTTGPQLISGAAQPVRDYAFEERVLERLELISRSLAEHAQPVIAVQ